MTEPGRPHLLLRHQVSQPLSQAADDLLTQWCCGIATPRRIDATGDEEEGRISIISAVALVLTCPSSALWDEKGSYLSSCSPIVCHLPPWGRVIPLHHPSSSGETRRTHGMRERQTDISLSSGEW